MYQGHSENNLLINPKQQYNIDESFIMTPINLNTHHPIKFNNIKQSHAQKSHLGQYEQFKLSPFLETTSHMYKQNDNGGYNPQLHIQYQNRNIIQNAQNNHIVQVVSIDPDSEILEIGDKFRYLMNKYSTNDICFITVVGQKQSGKSFLCDKIYNLAEVKGNHYCLKNNPAIYTYSIPFVKDNLMIFILEIAGCDINSNLFRILNTFAFLISTQFVFVGDCNPKDTEMDLYQGMKKITIQKKQQGQGQIYDWVFPKDMYYLTRNKDNMAVPPQLDKSFYFKHSHTAYLPDAMNPSYKGNKTDLSSFSFLAKQCINPEYIKCASSIFKTLYNTVSCKNYKELVINGNIVNKFTAAVVPLLNSGNKKIKVQQIYENIIKQLYKSAYNYCILSYHDQLQEYFGDELPKNVEAMYEVFEKTSQNAIKRFNQFNLDKNLHDQYQEKLIQYIDNKEVQISSINQQKTKQYLQNQFNKYKDHGDMKQMIKKLRMQNKQLNHGRSQAVRNILSQAFNNMGSDPSHLIKKYEQLCERKQALQLQIKRESQKLKSHLKEQQKNKSQYNSLQKEETQLEHDIKRITEAKQGLANGQNDAEILAAKRKHYQKLLERSKKIEDQLHLFKNQNNDDVLLQLKESYENKIRKIIEKQKEVQAQIQQIQKQELAQTAKPKQSNVKQGQKKVRIQQGDDKTQTKKKANPEELNKSKTKQTTKKSDIKQSKTKAR